MASSTSESTDPVTVDQEELRRVKDEAAKVAEKAPGEAPEKAPAEPETEEPAGPEEAPEKAKPKRRKRGGRRRAAAAPKRVPPRIRLTADACGALWDALFRVLGARLGEHWRLSPEEVEALGEPSNACLDRYLPDVFSEHAEILALALALLSVTMPRVIYHRQLKEAQKEAPAEGESGKEE